MLLVGEDADDVLHTQRANEAMEQLNAALKERSQQKPFYVNIMPHAAEADFASELGPNIYDEEDGADWDVEDDGGEVDSALLERLRADSKEIETRRDSKARNLKVVREFVESLKETK